MTFPSSIDTVRALLRPRSDGSALHEYSADALGALLAAGAVSAREVVDAHLERIAALEPVINALLRLDAGPSSAVADRVDRDRADGGRLGPLAGIPVALKDNIAQGGVPNTCGSRALANWRPDGDAEVVARLRRSRAAILGRANMDEFAMGASTETSATGPTRNPWNLSCTPGGSSGGSAAAVASAEVPLSLGTDTGGSIREPASLCGVVGVKPSYGAVSQRGVVPFAPSLDQVGVLARTVLDAALLHEAVAGYDPADPRSRRMSSAGLVAAASQGGAEPSLAGVRVGVVAELVGDRNNAGVRFRFERALALLERRGAELVPVSCPSFTDGLATYYAISSAECVPTLAPHVATGRVGDEAVRRYEHGLDLIQGRAGRAELAEAEAVRRVMSREMAAALVGCDVLASPTMPTTAPLLGRGVDDPLATPRTDVWTVVANLAGVPAMSLPCGLSPIDGMPVGFHLMAPARADVRLYRVGAVLETALSDE